MNGKVVGIYIAKAAGAPMTRVAEVEAIAGAGLKGDRYCTGEGSFNKGARGKRQVTLINEIFVDDDYHNFAHADTRRNIVVAGVELMWLIGKEFQIGTAKMRGVKYCDPCERPSLLADIQESFKEAFSDRGGLIAEVIEGGIIQAGDEVIPPPKGY